MSPKTPRYLSGIVDGEVWNCGPIFVKKKLAAELDVESYFVNTFTRS